MSTPRFALFPNGTSYMMWLDRNCDQCIKGPKAGHVGANTECAIEYAIAIASATDGTLTHCGQTPLNKADAIARRLNWDGKSYLTCDCPEVVR